MSKANNGPKLKTHDEVGKAILTIGNLQNEVAEREREMNERLARIKADYEERALPARQKLAELSAQVRDYCDERRESLVTQAGKKSIDFGSGEVIWKAGKPSVWVKPGLAIEKLIAALKDKRLGRFIRTKHELDKQAVLKDPEAVSAVKSMVRVESKEVFAIKPFATQIEQVL